MSKKKVIITGVSGFIGSNLAKWLSDEYKIIGIDKNPWDGFKKIKDAVFFQIDLTKDKLSDFDDVYAVIHLAARAGVRESQKEFEDYVKNNILGTKIILDKCVENWKPKKLLVASSSSVHGEEGNGIHPKSLYAMTKVATEDIIDTYRNNGLLVDTQAGALRIYTVYGPGQRKGLAIGNFITNILKDVPITVYGDGTQTRDFTYIDDLCRGINMLLDDRLIDETYDFGSQQAYSVNEIIHLISKLTNKVVRIKYEPMIRYDVMHTKSHYLICDHITPIEEGLKKQIEWTKSMLNLQ